MAPRKRSGARKWPPSAFGTYLKAHRKRLGLTQAELGDKVGVDGSYISQLETGRLPAMSLDFLDRLAAVLAVPTDTLITEGQLPRRNIFDVDVSKLSSDGKILMARTFHLTPAQIRQLALLAEAMAEDNAAASGDTTGHSPPSSNLTVEEEGADAEGPLLIS